MASAGTALSHQIAVGAKGHIVLWSANCRRRTRPPEIRFVRSPWPTFCTANLWPSGRGGVRDAGCVGRIRDAPGGYRPSCAVSALICLDRHGLVGREIEQGPVINNEPMAGREHEAVAGSGQEGAALNRNSKAGESWTGGDRIGHAHGQCWNGRIWPCSTAFIASARIAFSQARHGRYWRVRHVAFMASLDAPQLPFR